MVDIQTSTNLKCYHCGDICNNSPLLLNTKAFCCVGCKTVYELLGENFLCNYYSLTDTPGNKIPEVEKDGYAYLDDDLINNSLLNFQDGGISGVTFYIPNIHCSSCIWLLENLYKIHAGIVHSSIQFQKKEIDIQFNSSISLRELTQLLAAIGYAPSITLEGKKVSNKNIDRALYYKLGIAGFCFGNIMMLSLPEYLSVIDEFTGEIKNLFSIFSFLLAIPVFFYCASDYFISSLKAIKNKVINIDLPIALGLLAAFTQSTYELISGNGPGYFDSLTGLIFFLLIGKWYQKKTYEALSFDRDYKSYFPLAVNKIDGEEEKYVQLGILKIGDVISIRNNELIPADGLIIEGDANIDYSFVTGESLPVSKKPGELIFAGGRQQGPIIKIQLKKIVSESYLTQLWNKDNSKQKTTGLVDFTNKIGKYFTIGVLIISIGTYFYWLDKDSTKALYSAVSVLIIFCPCTLALAIPFCFGYAKNILGINGLFLKNTDTIEKIASNHAIVFDKTGTITYTEGSDVEYTGNLTPEDKVWVKSLVKNSTHPLCNIVSKYLTGIRVLIPDYFEEVISQGIKASFGNNSIKIGSPAFTGFLKTKKSLDLMPTMVCVNINGVVKGYFKFRNRYRKNLKILLHTLQKNYQLHLLSGDNDSEREYLGSLFDETKIHFNQSPLDKLKYVKELDKQKKVLMVGDGLNDAGALLHSNCGISIVEKSGMFSPSSDAILEASQIQNLPLFLEYSKACLKVVYFSLFISLSYNFVGLYFAVLGNLKPLVAAILMPLSSVSVVVFVTLMSKLLAMKYKLSKN